MILARSSVLGQEKGTEMEGERTYLLGPRERSGLIAGWRVGQVAMIGSGCGAGLICVAVSSRAPGFLMALFFVVSGLALGTLPIRGRSVDEWIPPLLAYARIHGTSSQDLFRVTPGVALGYPEEIGLIEDNAGSVSVVLFVESSGIALLTGQAKDARIDGFITALSSLARERPVIDCVSWSMWTTASEPGERYRDLRKRSENATQESSQSYRDFLEEVGRVGVSRHVAITLRMSSKRIQDSSVSLVDEAHALSRALRESGHPSVSIASASEIIDLFDHHPGCRSHRGDASTQISFEGTSHFTMLECDNKLVNSWWIMEWPKFEVTAEFLAPLVLGDTSRTISVVVELVPPSVALRRAQSAKTSGVADQELRRRGGFLLDRRRERESGHLENREAELIDGHRSLRIVGYVAVTADDDASLQSKISETELAGAQAHLGLLRLNGDHLRGYLATLPLARGLP